MPWSVTIKRDRSVIEVVAAGTLAKADLEAALSGIRRLASKYHVACILSDCTKLADGGHSIGDLFFLAQTIEASELANSFKEEILLPSSPAAARMTRFWKMTCVNHGLKVRIFKSRKNALAWLLE